MWGYKIIVDSYDVQIVSSISASIVSASIHRTMRQIQKKD